MLTTGSNEINISVINPSNPSEPLAIQTEPFDFTLFSGSLIAGSNTVTFTDITLPNNFFQTCDDVNPNVTGITGTVWEQSFTDGVALCVTGSRPNRIAPVDLTLDTGTIEVGNVQGAVAAGLGYTLSNTVLGPSDVTYDSASIELPDGVTVHEPVLINPAATANRPNPKGVSVINFVSAGPVATPDDIVLELTEPKFLYSYGLPFFIVFSGLVIDFDDANGLSFTTAQAYHTDFFHYYYMATYQTGDSRLVNRLPSNNSPFFAGTFASLRINGNGLQGTLNFNNSGNTGYFNTAYPKGRISWGNFQVILADGVIQPATILNVDYSMTVSGTCPEGVCGENAPGTSYDFTGLALGIADDCALGGQVADSGQTTAWGKYNGSRYTFEKDDRGRGMLFFPGSLVSGSEASDGVDEDHTISEYLFGAREFTGVSTLGTHAYLDDSDNRDARNGNHYFAGLTLGPQTLTPHVSAGLTDAIDDTDLSLLFNGETVPVAFDVRDYTKYVIRPGGVTGVFNTRFSGLLSIYGYDLHLSRFAFRQDVNRLDEESFIDGYLDLPHPADLRVGFTSLEMTCTGDMAGGQVDGENSGDTLAFWNTPVDLLGMGFEDTGGDTACPDPANRQLRLDSSNQVNGLSKRVTLSAFWSPAGDPSQDTMTSAVAQRMDTPEEGNDSGFSVVLRDGYLYHDTDYTATTVTGFTNLNLLVDLPLFDDMPVLGHFQNDAEDAFTLFLSKDDPAFGDTDMNGIPDSIYGTWDLEQYRNELAKDDESLTPDPRPNAEYSWAGLINLDYPLHYDRAGTDTGPQFRGVKQISNLPGGSDPVIVISSVPDYLKPDMAKVSFGATADVAELKNFHVDTSSLTGNLDNFLSNQLGVALPIEGLLSDLVGSTGSMHEVTGGDITELLKPSLDTALGVPAVDNAFSALSNVIRTLHQAPGILTSQVENRINDTRDRLVSAITNDLATPFDKLMNTDLAVYVTYDPLALESGGIYSPAELQDFETDLSTTLARLNNVMESVDGLAHELTSMRSMIQSLREDVDNTVGTVAAAVTDANNALTSLTEYTSPDMATNPMLTRVNDAKTKIENAISAIKNLDIGQIGDALKQAASLAGADIDTSMIDDADAFFDSRVAELEQLMSDAENQLESALGSLGLGSVFSEAQTRITYVQTHLTTLNSQLTTVFDLVLGNAADPSDLGYLGTLDQSLATLGGFINGFEQSISQDRLMTFGTLTTKEELILAGQDKLNQLAASLISDLAAAGGDLGGTASMILSGIDLSNPADAFEQVFQNGLTSLITAPLDQVTGSISAQMAAVTEQAMSFIPDASADDLKQMVKSAILNSAPIQNLNTTFYEQFGFVSNYVDDLSGEVTSKINGLINDAVAAISEGLNNQLANVQSNVGGSGEDVSAAKMDGYALVSQDELQRIHIDAEFQFGGKPKPTTYYAMLDITNWNAENGKGSGCPSDVGGESMFDVVISTKDVKADMLGTDIGIKTACLGFTFMSLTPIGIFGNVYTSGELDFEAVTLKDMGLEAGIGAIENYLGAKATGKFESYTISAVFFFGKTCDFEVLKRLDKDIEDFIGAQTAFTGVYVRGGAEIPIFNYGCFLKVGVGAEVGAWYLTQPVPTYGGMFGGSAYGRVACLAALKGKVLLSGSKVGDQYRFYGMGWGAGGIGFCEPSKWDTVAKSRKDSWCSTGDATFEATYSNGWSISGPEVHCCY